MFHESRDSTNEFELDLQQFCDSLGGTSLELLCGEMMTWGIMALQSRSKGQRDKDSYCLGSRHYLTVRICQVNVAVYDPGNKYECFADAPQTSNAR